MKVRTLALVLGIASFSSCAIAEYYVVNTPYDIYATPRHLRYHTKVRHYVHHYYYDLWKIRHRHCYDPDLTTGDDDPCMYPGMDIDE